MASTAPALTSAAMTGVKGASATRPTSRCSGPQASWAGRGGTRRPSGRLRVAVAPRGPSAGGRPAPAASRAVTVDGGHHEPSRNANHARVPRLVEGEMRPAGGLPQERLDGGRERPLGMRTIRRVRTRAAIPRSSRGKHTARGDGFTSLLGKRPMAPHRPGGLGSSSSGRCARSAEWHVDPRDGYRCGDGSASPGRALTAGAGSAPCARCRAPGSHSRARRGGR